MNSAQGNLTLHCFSSNPCCSLLPLSPLPPFLLSTTFCICVMLHFEIGSDSNGNTSVDTEAENLKRKVHGDVVGWTEMQSRWGERYIKRSKVLKIQTVRWRWRDKKLWWQKKQSSMKLLGSESLKKIFIYHGRRWCWLALYFVCPYLWNTDMLLYDFRFGDRKASSLSCLLFCLFCDFHLYGNIQSPFLIWIFRYIHSPFKYYHKQDIS